MSTLLTCFPDEILLYILSYLNTFATLQLDNAVTSRSLRSLWEKILEKHLGPKYLPKQILEGAKYETFSLAVDPNHLLIASGHRAGEICLWDFNSGDLLLRVDMPLRDLYSLWILLLGYHQEEADKKKTISLEECYSNGNHVSECMIRLTNGNLAIVLSSFGEGSEKIVIINPKDNFKIVSKIHQQLVEFISSLLELSNGNLLLHGKEGNMVILDIKSKKEIRSIQIINTEFFQDFWVQPIQLTDSRVVVGFEKGLKYGLKFFDITTGKTVGEITTNPYCVLSVDQIDSNTLAVVLALREKDGNFVNYGIRTININNLQPGRQITTTKKIGLSENPFAFIHFNDALLVKEEKSIVIWTQSN